jgi:hypothetical protein
LFCDFLMGAVDLLIGGLLAGLLMSVFLGFWIDFLGPPRAKRG